MNLREPDDLKNVGLKATLPRLKVLSLFESSKERHMSAEDVYKILLGSGDDVGLATVYRVLTQFEQAGLLVRHHFEGGKAVFELNQGGITIILFASNVAASKSFVMKKSKRFNTRLLRIVALKLTNIHSIFTPTAQKRPALISK